MREGGDGRTIEPTGVDLGPLGETPVKATATNGADAAAARLAAPEIPLWSNGTLEVYAKCLYDTGATEIHGEMYVRTSTDGAMMEGTDDLPGAGTGDQFLNVATAEVDRQLDTQTTAVADMASYNEAEGSLTGADGYGYYAVTHIGVKQGNPAGGNGPFGGAVFG